MINDFINVIICLISLLSYYILIQYTKSTNEGRDRYISADR